MFLSPKEKPIKKVLSVCLVAAMASTRSAIAQEAPTDLTVLAPPSLDTAQSSGTPLNEVFPQDITARADDQSNNVDSILNDPVTGLPDQRTTIQSDVVSRQNQRPRRAEQVGIVGPDGAITPLANSREPAVQGGGLRSDDDPFAALGMRVGSFTLFPVLTQNFGYTDNADFAADGDPSAFSQSDLRISGESNWARHQLRGEIGGDYEYFFNGTSDDLPNVNGNVELRLDLTDDWTARFGAVGDLTTESATSNNVTVPAPLTVTERPKLAVYGGYAEIDRQAGRLDTRLRGTFTRSQYGDAELSDGGSLSQDGRTNNLFALTARVGYDSSPSFRPFVEGTLGVRDYKLDEDSNGMNRDSNLGALRAGVAFDRGEKLNGELSVGYAREVFDDSELKPLEGVTVNGAINWSPHRFTTVSSTVQTQFNESSNAGESGSVTYAGTIGVTRDVRADLALNARLLGSIQSYEGSGREDRTLQVQAGAEWRVSRMLAVLGNIGYETVDSTDEASTYDAITARIGLRLQR